MYTTKSYNTADSSLEKINRESDFDFAFRMLNAGEHDFDGCVYSQLSLGRRFHFGRHGGRCFHCEVGDGDMVRVFCDNAGLGLGRLAVKWTIHVPDEMHADGFRSEADKLDLPIELVSDGSGLAGASVTVGGNELARRLERIEEKLDNLSPSQGDVSEDMTAEEGAALAESVFRDYYE